MLEKALLCLVPEITRPRATMLLKSPISVLVVWMVQASRSLGSDSRRVSSRLARHRGGEGKDIAVLEISARIN